MLNVVLHNRYRIDSELGQGGMGAVYRAHDQLLDRTVALKLLNAANLGAEGRERLLREARAAARLNHPNIVGIYDVSGAAEAEGQPFIVMELVEGHSLYDRPPGSLAEILAVASQICAALDHAHTHGIVHRDLKLENVLLTREGTVKLADFGLARSFASRLTAEGTILGTVFYLAPELALGQEFDGRADLYALGVLLYELTTHRLPFDGDDPLAVVSQHLHAPVVPPRAHTPEIPPALEALIVQLLSKRPADRPASAAEVKSALEKITVESEQPAHPAGSRHDSLSVLDRIVRGRIVGRERELAEAAALWRKAAQGEGRVLLISGEPGIGKSRLARELTALVEVAGGVALGGECDAETGVPYSPIAQMIQASFSQHAALPAALSSLVLADLITIAPALRTRFPEVPPNPSLDPPAEHQRIFESVMEWAAAVAARAPLLLVVDDAHWADSGTLALLRRLARRGRALKMRLLIALTYREMELAETHPLNGTLIDLNHERLADRIKLTRLSREHTQMLLNVMLEAETAPEFIDSIYHETEGNPFFIEEVCKALIEAGQLVFEAGHWQSPQTGEMRVPQSVRAAIQARVGKLSDPAQNVLRLAAVLGREFDFDLLQQASETPEEGLIEALEQAARAQLIAETKSTLRGVAETFSFAHALIPAALRESVSGLRRHRLHRQAALALEALRPDAYEGLAYHYAEAGDEERARRYYVRAGARAQQVYANQDAIKFYTEALALLPATDRERFDILRARAAVYDVIADREAQRADAEAMLALAEGRNDDICRFDALLTLADVLAETDHLKGAEPTERALRIARALGDKVREAQALRRVAWLDVLKTDYAPSRAALETAIAYFREAEQRAEAATCLHMLSLVLGRTGAIEAAKQAVEESIALSRAVGDRRQEAIGLRRLGILHNLSGHIREGIQHTLLALAAHRAMGDRSQELNALANLSSAYGNLGAWEEASRYAQLTLELGEAIDSSEGITKGIDSMVSFYYRPRGDYGGALKFVETQTAKARLKSDDQLLLKVRAFNGTILAALGLFHAVLELAGDFYSFSKKFGAGIAADILTFIAVLHAEVDEFSDARQTLQQAAALLTAQSTPAERANVLATGGYIDLLAGLAEADSQARQAIYRQGLEKVKQALELLDHTLGEGLAEFRGAVLSGLAWLCLETGQSAEALTYSRRAVDLLDTYPALWIRAPEQILYSHTRALRANGREAEADDYLRRAYDRVQCVLNSLEDEALRRSWLENVKFNRMLMADWQARQSHR